MSSVYELSRRDDMAMSETSADIASGTYLYFHLYHPDSTSPVFVPYDESYVQTSGNVCIPGEDYKTQWARLEQKIPVDGMGARFGTFSYYYRPQQDLWIVGLGFYGFHKDFARSKTMPAFRSLQHALIGASQIFEDEALFRQLLWQCNRSKKFPVEKPEQIEKFGDHVDNCIDVVFDKKRKVFVEKDSLATVAAAQTQNASQPIVPLSSTTSKSKKKRKRDEKQTQTAKRSKPLDIKSVDFMIVDTDLYGKIRVDYADDYIAIRLSSEYKHMETTCEFGNFDYGDALQHSSLFSSAFKHAKICANAVMSFEKNARSILITTDSRTILVR